MSVLLLYKEQNLSSSDMRRMREATERLILLERLFEADVAVDAAVVAAAFVAAVVVMVVVSDERSNISLAIE